jgi:hypothetical protein
MEQYQFYLLCGVVYLARVLSREACILGVIVCVTAGFLAS